MEILYEIDLRRYTVGEERVKRFAACDCLLSE